MNNLNKTKNKVLIANGERWIKNQYNSYNNPFIEKVKNIKPYLIFNLIIFYFFIRKFGLCKKVKVVFTNIVNMIYFYK